MGDESTLGNPSRGCRPTFFRLREILHRYGARSVFHFVIRANIFLASRPTFLLSFSVTSRLFIPKGLKNLRRLNVTIVLLFLLLVFLYFSAVFSPLICTNEHSVVLWRITWHNLHRLSGRPARHIYFCMCNLIASS